MRKPRPRLDPVTLRWCAEQSDADVEHYDDLVARAVASRGWEGESETWRQVARQRRRWSKQLRNLATREERKS